MVRKWEIRHRLTFKVLGLILGMSFPANSGLVGTQRVPDTRGSKQKKMFLIFLKVEGVKMILKVSLSVSNA